MNNTKRSRHKIYHIIDVIFLLLPIIFYVSGILQSLFFSLTIRLDTESFSTYFFDNFRFADLDNVLILMLDNSFFGDDLIGYLDTFINNIFDFLGYDYMASTGGYTIKYYTEYIIFYEFLSLFINIVLWLPRWLRDKFQSEV